MRTLPLAVLATFLLCGAVRAELQTADEIDACFRGNFPATSSVQTISMNSVDRIGAVTTSRAKLYRKKFDDGRSKVLMRFHKPAEMRGAGLLMVEKKDRNDMFMYLPELDRVKRVTKHMTSGSMFGTDFSYEEFERIQGIAEDAPTERLEDESLDGHPMYVLLAKPGPDQESAYERIKTWIDKQSCIAARAEFYERGDAPRKIMTAKLDRVTQEKDVFVPREILMEDRRDETHTTLLIEEIDVGAEIHRKMFSERELVQGAR